MKEWHIGMFPSYSYFQYALHANSISFVNLIELLSSIYVRERVGMQVRITHNTSQMRTRIQAHFVAVYE